MSNNQTETTCNPLAAFGVPDTVFVNGLQYKNKYVIEALLVNLTANAKDIKHFVLTRIGGVVKAYITTTEAAK